MLNRLGESSWSARLARLGRGPIVTVAAATLLLGIPATSASAGTATDVLQRIAPSRLSPTVPRLTRSRAASSNYYTLTLLGYPPGGGQPGDPLLQPNQVWFDSAEREGLTSNGLVSGIGLNSSGKTAGVIWNGAKTTTQCQLTEAHSLNDVATVSVGTIQVKVKGTTVVHAASCSGASTQTDLGAKLGATMSVATDINKNGLVVGYSSGPQTNSSPLMFSGGNVINLGSFGGATGKAWAVNDSGQIVGESSDSAANVHPFVYSGGVFSNPVSGLAGRATDINNRGDILIGQVANQNAMLVRAGGSITDLGRLPGDDRLPQAWAVNSTDDVVGESNSTYTGSDPWKAGLSWARGFVYHNGFMYDLNQYAGVSYPYDISHAYDINDRGQILIVVYDDSSPLGFPRNYTALLTPTAPLPSPAPANTAPPTISGNPIIGFSLVGSPGSWSVVNGAPSPTYTYQWQLCSSAGANCANIAEATDSTYLVTGNLGATIRLQVTARNPYGSATATSTATRVVADALGTFAPALSYDSREKYKADWPGELTDNCSGTGNFLYDSTGAAIASPCGTPGDPYFLWLGYLGRTYSTGAQATADDYIDENDNYETDYLVMRARDGNADKILGRVVRNPDGSAIIQYWFFYYYQPNFIYGGGAHEGDWEGIMIFVDAHGNPIDSTYSQHGKGELCGWNFGAHTDLHPIVFVALSSHASYYTPGSHALEWGATDENDGLGYPPTIPTVVNVTDTQAQIYSWLFWPGSWGGTKSFVPKIDQSSPNGPGVKGTQWDDPFTWQSNPDVKSCYESQ